jgi:ADP-heptose:LPS heptosyltransferase
MKEVRRERFDAAFNFSAADRTLFMTALTGARWRVAYAGGRPHFWNKWLIGNWMRPLGSPQPAYERRRQMLADCGLQLSEARFDLEPPNTARDWARENVPEGAIHFSVNASTHLKEWPLEHWIELARLVWRERPGTSIVATASPKPRERSRLKLFSDTLNDSRLRTFGELSIPQLTALLECCSLHVGADSGVLHVAMSCGTATVSLFRDYPGMQAWIPRGERHRSLIVQCPCANLKPAPCLARDAAQCLAGIPPARVLEAVVERLKVATA